MLRHVDLCSGIGGFALGFQWAGLSVPVLFCDKDQFCQRVLAKHWPDVPIAEDVKELANDPTRLVPDCDIITAGYPCQPFSLAGKRKGEADDRHIWPFILEIVAQKRPAFCVFENVYGHLNMGLDKVLFDLEAQNYASRTFIVPACGVDAPHKRDRLWIIAHTNSHCEPDGTINEQQMVANTSRSKCSTGSKKPRALSSLQKDGAKHDNTCGRSENVADTTSQRQQRQGSSRDSSNSTQRGKGQATEFINGSFGDKRQLESRMGDLVDGIPSRLDRFDGWEREPEDIPRVAIRVKDRVNRLKGLGNAIVPQIAQQIGETIKEIHYGDH